MNECKNQLKFYSWQTVNAYNLYNITRLFITCIRMNWFKLAKELVKNYYLNNSIDMYHIYWYSISQFDFPVLFTLDIYTFKHFHPSKCRWKKAELGK